MPHLTELNPSTEAELAEIVKAAVGSIVISGGGTRPVGRITTGQGVSTKAISGIKVYDPGAMTLVAAAGTRLSDVEEVLDRENQQLAFEPMDHRTLLGTTGEPTLGGVFAGNISGPRRVQVGAARDHALGLRFVDGSGEIIQNGGRVMKNVTGYDLVKLMCGSWGTLGIVTEISCKVMPKPQTSATVKVHLPSWDGLIKCLSAALRTPFDVSGAAGLPQDDGVVGVVRVEGFAESVAYRAQKLADLLGAFGPVDVEYDRLWADVRDVVALRSCETVWSVNLRPSRVHTLFSELDIIGQYDRLVDWGGGRVWIGMQNINVQRTHENIQSIATTLGGHATLVKSADQNVTHHFPKQSATIERLQAGLRDKFDPRGIFNQGRMT